MNLLSRHRPALATAIVAGVVLGTAAWALASRVEAGTWSWDGSIPGHQIRQEGSVALVLRISPTVDGRTVREVISAGSDDRRLTLLAARGANERPCFAVASTGISTGFSCLNEVAERHAIVKKVAHGGDVIGVSEWAVLVGIARSDVTRVVLTLHDGTQRELPLNRWRAFAYESVTSSALPRVLSAYRADGTRIEEQVVTL